MKRYNADKWVILKFDFSDDRKSDYRVLATFYGGYLDGDNWRLNSGITKAEEDGDCYIFHGATGSAYRCPKEMYSLSMATAPVLSSFKAAAEKNGTYSVEMMPEDTDWMNVDYEGP